MLLFISFFLAIMHFNLQIFNFTLFLYTYIFSVFYIYEVSQLMVAYAFTPHTWASDVGNFSEF